MRFLLLLVVLAAAPAQADLYRWRDPQSGSIKYSNLPPPWYGDPEKEARAPRVEVVPDLSPRGHSAPPQLTASPAPVRPAAETPLSVLEAQFAALLQSFRSMSTSGDFDRTGAVLRQQAELYRAVSAELDRLDPAGAARRRALAMKSGVFDQLKRGLEAQLAAKPPAQR